MQLQELKPEIIFDNSEFKKSELTEPINNKEDTDNCAEIILQNKELFNKIYKGFSFEKEQNYLISQFSNFPNKEFIIDELIKKIETELKLKEKIECPNQKHKFQRTPRKIGFDFSKDSPYQKEWDKINYGRQNDWLIFYSQNLFCLKELPCKNIDTFFIIYHSKEILKYYKFLKDIKENEFVIPTINIEDLLINNSNAFELDDIKEIPIDTIQYEIINQTRKKYFSNITEFLSTKIDIKKAIKGTKNLSVEKIFNDDLQLKNNPLKMETMSVSKIIGWLQLWLFKRYTDNNHKSFLTTDTYKTKFENYKNNYLNSSIDTDEKDFIKDELDKCEAILIELSKPIYDKIDILCEIKNEPCEFKKYLMNSIDKRIKFLKKNEIQNNNDEVLNIKDLPTCKEIALICFYKNILIERNGNYEKLLKSYNPNLNSSITLYNKYINIISQTNRVNDAGSDKKNINKANSFKKIISIFKNENTDLTQIEKEFTTFKSQLNIDIN